MTFTIEPMINAGKREIREMGDGWTIVTKDRSLSAQWEHTVLVTENGYEVLTLSAGSPPPPDFVTALMPRFDAVMSAVLRRGRFDEPRSLRALRSHFRDGKAALIEHFREARASAPAATRCCAA